MSKQNHGFTNRHVIVSVAALALLGFGVFLVWPTFAQNADPEADSEKDGQQTETNQTEKNQTEKNEPKTASSANQDASQNANADGIPDGPPEKILQFIRASVQELSQNPPEDDKQFKQGLLTILKASEKILAADAEPEIRMEAIRAKAGMLKGLKQFGDETAGRKLVKFLMRLKTDKSSAVRELAQSQLLLLRADKAATLDNKAREQLINDALSFVRDGDELRQRFGIGMAVGQSLEQAGRNEAAARMYRQLAKLLSKSDDEQLAKQAPVIEGFARRVTLIGKPIKINGKTVEGESFNIKKFKGKVVLVDFWATWCAPCRFLMPQLKKKYEKYHDDGFEVVGVSVDSDKQALAEYVKEEELPWPNLYGGRPVEGGHPVADYYGVMKYPTTILVNREGKVVAMDLHGAQLERKIVQLLGDDAKPEPDAGSNGAPKAESPDAKKDAATEKESNKDGSSADSDG